MKYSVIIPCYNEQENINDLIRNLEQCKCELDIQWILVENGSLDGTRALLKKNCEGKQGFVLVFVDHNQGYGYGIQRGIEKATGDYIGWLHADMQLDPKDMIKLMRVADREKRTNLFLKGRRRNRSLLDRFFTKCMTVYASIMLGVGIFDIGAVPVLFHRSLLKFLTTIPYDGSIETYVYAMAKKKGFEIRRYDVKQRDRIKGVSSWNRGFASRINQSIVIMKDILLIREGKPVK